MKYILIFSTLLFSVFNVKAQCPQDNTFILNVTPPCPGTSTVSCMNGGEFVTVNVTAGNNYSFSTCGNIAFDTEITVYNGATLIGYSDDDCGSQSTVNWTATFTGTVDVLVDEFQCANTGLCTDLVVSCSLPVQTGNGCNTNTTICSQGVAGPFAFSTPGNAISSCLDWIAPSFAYIILYITQSGPLEMLVTGDVAAGFLDVSIFNIPAGADPCIAIQDVTNEISCNYADFDDGCNEIGTYFGCTSSVPSPVVTAGDVLMIIVENWSNASTNFTLELAPVPAAQTGPPDATITQVGPFCTNSPAVQLAAADMGGTWSGPGTSATGLFNPATAGLGSHTINYSVGQNPCNSSSSTTIIVAPAPITGIASTPINVFCGTVDIPLTLTGAVGIIQWETAAISGGPWTAISGATTANYTVIGVSTNSCFRAVISGCGAPVFSNVICVTFGAQVTPLFNSVGPICSGASLPALPLLSNNGITGTWSPAINNIATTVYTFMPNAGQCSSTAQMTINVVAAPLATFVPDVTEGCAPLQVNFTNTTPNSVDCIWTLSNGITLSGCGTVTTTFNQSGCFDVTLTSTAANGCISSYTAIDLVCVDDSPVAAFIPSASSISETNPEVYFSNTSINATSYFWDFGDNSSSSSAENPSHEYGTEAAANYVVMLVAFSQGGCVDTTYATIQIVEELVFYIPNSFSPDDDFFNPTFQPIFTAGFDPYDFSMFIYNRWGELIFETHDTEIGWNGSYGAKNEKPVVQDGVYSWKIEFKTARNDERKLVMGHVNLVK